MASVLKVDKLDPQSGTALEIGTSGDTITVPTGAGLTVVDEVKTNKISPSSGVAFTLGDSGDTFTVPSGATIVNSGTATGFGVGKIGQVVTSNIDASGFNTSSTSYVTTGTSLAITPTATSSKVLILYTGLEMDNQGATVAYATIYNGVTNLASSDTFFYLYGGDRVAVSGTIQHIHSPSSTSAQTYTIYVKTNSGTVGFLEDSTDATLTLMEILA